MSDARTRLYQMLADGNTIHCWPPMPLRYRIKNALLRSLDHPALIAAILLAIIAAVLSGCAQPYWIKDHPLVTPMGERMVAQAEIESRCLALGQTTCSGLWGLFDRTTGITYIADVVPESARACLLAHELKHANGFSHPVTSRDFIDCGDGTFISATTARGME